MRDIYATDIERSRFHSWLRGEEPDPDAEAEWWRPWFEMMAANRAAGKTLRRLRIVSEPVTEYIYFEWLDAFNLARAETVTLTHFSGDGHVLAQERATEPDIVGNCKAAFETAWKLGIPHHEYEPTQA